MGTGTRLRTCLLRLHCSTGDLNQLMIGLTTNYSLYVSGTGSSTEFSASSTSTSIIMLSIMVDSIRDYSHYIWVLVFVLCQPVPQSSHPTFGRFLLEII